MNKLENLDSDHHANAGNVEIEQESFFLLSFVSWLHNFDNSSHWEFRAGNKGIFAIISLVLLFSQTLVLFDLAYEENRADYKCLGDSARLSVVICGALVMFIVCLKMLAEERRALCQRFVLIRHATENSYYYSLYHLIFGKKRMRALKLLLMCIFQSVREFGVLTFVYVAAVEQLMILDTIIDYIINSVVVLVVAELDELIFKVLEKGAYVPVRSRCNSTSATVHRYDDSFVDEEDEANIDSGVASHKLLINKQEELLYNEDIEDSRRPSVLYHNYKTHSGPANIREMVALSLSPVENEIFLVCDNVMLFLNFFIITLPLLNGKLTGNNCSEHSRLRVSELAMLGLFSVRVLINIYVDIKLQASRGKWSEVTSTNRFAYLPLIFWSLLEHGLPCFAYTTLMYLVFVKELKPASD